MLTKKKAHELKLLLLNFVDQLTILKFKLNLFLNSYKIKQNKQENPKLN